MTGLLLREVIADNECIIGSADSDSAILTILNRSNESPS